MAVSDLDYRICDELFHDARRPLKDIAKSLGVTRQTVQQHIEQLENRGIIRSYETHIDYYSLGFIHAECYATFRSFLETERKQIIDYFVQHEWVRWVGEAFGVPQLRFNIIARDITHLQTILSQSRAHFGDELLDVSVWLIQPDNKIIPHVTLDLADAQLLGALQSDARATLHQLAQRAGLSLEAARLRKLKLEKSRIITKYTVSVDWENLSSRVWVILYLKLRSVRENTKRIEYLLGKEKAFRKAEWIVGPWDCEISIEGKDLYDLHKAIEDMLSTLKDDLILAKPVIMLRSNKHPKVATGALKYLAHNLNATS